MNQRNEEMGFSAEQLFAFTAWAYGLAFDLEWEAYKGGHEAGVGYRRYRQDRAWWLNATFNNTLFACPEVHVAQPEEEKFARLSLGMRRDRAAAHREASRRRTHAAWFSQR